MTKRNTLAEIARLAGVNSSTVSRALNPATASLISETKRRRIIELCDLHNYRPRRAARGCATGRNYSIGYISGALAKDLSSPFISLYLAAIANELQRSGYSLLMLSTENTPGTLEEGVRDILLSDTADGYIISAGMLKQQAREISHCTGRPVLTLGYHNFRQQGDFPYVEISISRAIGEIWQVIAEHMPVINCCFFGKPTVSSRAKVAQIRSLAPPGTEVPVLYIPRPVNYSLMDYSQAFQCAEKQWKTLSKFNLIWCGSDLVASALCDVMRRNGIRPGREIMVVGYDHLAAAIPGFPDTIATIDPCWGEVGRLSARKILGFVSDPGAERDSEQISARYIPGATLPFGPRNSAKKQLQPNTEVPPCSTRKRKKETPSR